MWWRLLCWTTDACPSYSYLKGVSAHANYINLKGESNTYNAYWYWRDLGALDKIYLPYSIIQNLTSPVLSMVIVVPFIDNSMISKPCTHLLIRVWSSPDDNWIQHINWHWTANNSHVYYLPSSGRGKDVSSNARHISQQRKICPSIYN